MSSLPDTLSNLETALNDVELVLNPLLAQPMSDLLAKLSTVERCKIQAFIAYSINTLFFIYIKVNGINPRYHKVMGELQRIQKYIIKINKAEGHGEKRKMNLDKDAAGRFIKHGLSGNDKSKN